MRLYTFEAASDIVLTCSGPMKNTAFLPYKIDTFQAKSDEFRVVFLFVVFSLLKPSIVGSRRTVSLKRF